MPASSAVLLMKQYKQLTEPKTALPSFHITLPDEDNIYNWQIGVMVLDPGSVYHGGYFLAQMKFPKDYPFNPPKFRFIRPFYHPNVYTDGRLCISILHAGEDETSGELGSERWSPAQSVESVLVSIVSLLDDPNPDSPANVDAAKQWRLDREGYDVLARKQVEESKKDIPSGFVMPTEATSLPRPPTPEDAYDDSFWYDEGSGDDDFAEDYDDNEGQDDDEDEGADIE